MSIAVAQFIFGFVGMLIMLIVTFGTIAMIVSLEFYWWGTPMPGPVMGGMVALVGVVVIAAAVLVAVIK